MFSLIRTRPITLLRLAQNPIGHGVRQNSNHTPDSYSKEVDYTPPHDEKIHRVDPDSDRVQKPHEPLSGWSRAGVTDKYRVEEHMLKGESNRYGASKTLAEDKGSRDE